MRVVIFIACLIGAVLAAPATPAAPATYEYGGAVSYGGVVPGNPVIMHANPTNAKDAAAGQTVLTPTGSGDASHCECLGKPACPCESQAAPPTCCKAADTCHPSVPKCDAVAPTTVPRGSLKEPEAPSCCQVHETCHESVPKCPVAVEAAPVAAAPSCCAAADTCHPSVPKCEAEHNYGSITEDAAIPKINWGQLPMYMAPVKVIGANQPVDKCGCVHLDVCPCREVAPWKAPEIKAVPECGCHAEAECPCAQQTVEPELKEPESPCGCVHLDVCPCKAQTVEPELKEETPCCPHGDQCHPAATKCPAAVEAESVPVQTSLESNCCQAHETCPEKPQCAAAPATVEAEVAPAAAPACPCMKEDNRVEAEAVDHLCPCAKKMVLHPVATEAPAPSCCAAEPCHPTVPKCSEASTLANGGKNVAVVHGNVVH